MQTVYLCGGINGLTYADAKDWRDVAKFALFRAGFKLKGLERAARWMSSADSMAWSMQARRGAPLPVCSHRHCTNCALYALNWREKALRAACRGDRVKTQPTLF